MTTTSLSAESVPLTGARSRRARGRRWVILLLGAVVVLLAYAGFLRATRIAPPAIDPAVRAAAEQPLLQKGNRIYVGEQWMSRERGLWEMHFAGEPYQMGFAMTRLGSHLDTEQEDYMFGELDRYVPSSIARWLIRNSVRWKYRNLADSIPAARMQEMAGVAAGKVDLHGDFLPAFHRVVFYHALHDITQSLEQSPLLGCTAFAASGSATQNGHLLIGRNFDFEGPEIFDREKAVLFYKPKDKIAFASVAWVGMTGVVTGLSAEGIFVSINAARTDDKGRDGVPVELLLRQVLEEAHSIDEAIAIIKKAPVMVPDFYLLGDGKTGESAVIERSPTRLEVRRTGPRGGTTVLANHALQPAFTGDAENDRLRRYLTSGARHKRMAELVQKWSGSIEPRRAADILRDKKGPQGEPLGLGNRNALDALIATHSVIADASAGILWINEGPHILGRYIGYDLRRELLGEERPTPVDLPPDPLRDGEELASYKQALIALRAAERFAKAGHRDRAIEQARRAVSTAELMPEAHLQLADLLAKGGETELARKHYQRFLELSPPYLKDIERVRGVLGVN